MPSAASTSACPSSDFRNRRCRGMGRSDTMHPPLGPDCNTFTRVVNAFWTHQDALSCSLRHKLGAPMWLEPNNFCQLCYPRIRIVNAWHLSPDYSSTPVRPAVRIFCHSKRMEALGRVELPTNGLGNRCSIHLSYRAGAWQQNYLMLQHAGPAFVTRPQSKLGLSRKSGQEKPILRGNRVCPRATTRLLTSLMLTIVSTGLKYEMD